MLFGMSAFAQSGWTNPSGNYQLETVVYAVVDCGDYALYNSDVMPEVAAFVDGELRAVVTEYTTPPNAAPSGDIMRIYTLRVGGEGSDDGKTITFKLYDPVSGLIYPLEVSGGNTVTWTGDNTAVYPSNYYTLTASPASTAKLFYNDGEAVTESPRISLRIGDIVSLGNYYVKFYDVYSKEVQVDNDRGVWNISGNYVTEESKEDGIYIRGVNETPDNDGDGEADYDEKSIIYNIGNFSFNIPVQVLEEYIPVESIAVNDYDYYWPGYGRLVLSENNVIFNNGESIPTYTDVTILSSSNTDVVEIIDNILVFRSIGISEIAIASVDNPEKTATFKVNILSALSSMETGFENDTYECQRWSSGEEELKFPMPMFNWVKNEDGMPVIGNDVNEAFIMESSDPTVIRIDHVEGEVSTYHTVMSLKKGTAYVTCTSAYDPTKSVTYKVVVKQAISSVTITEIDGKSVENVDQMPEVDVVVGKIVTAKAVVDPLDADYENFSMQFVNANWGEIENAAEYVEVIGTAAADGVCTFQFRFNAVPQEGYYLQAVADMDYLSSIVKLNVVRKVAGIELSETIMNFWIDEGSLQFDIDVKLTPDDAVDKRYTVETNNADVISIVPASETETESSYYYYAVGKGNAKLTFRSVDNPEVVATCDVTVKRRVNSITVEGLASEIYNDGETYTATLSYFPSDADFDAEALTYDVSTMGASHPYDWRLLDINISDAFEGGINLEIVPRTLCSNISISFNYDTQVQEGQEILTHVAETSVREKLTLGVNWNWISIISADYSLENLREVLVEARSKGELVYNDPVWGLFGSLSTLGRDEAYKVNIMEGIESYDIYLTGDQMLSTDGSVNDKEFVKGWNWVSYPYEYSYPVEAIFAASNFAEGDVILAKNSGFVTLTDGKWEGSLESLNPNEGYMVYCNSTEGLTLSMPNRYSLTQGYFSNNGAARAAAKERSVWNYNDSHFANTMAVIAKIDVEDCESYSIGAFVGDECRGEGKFINGKAYISVAGEMGEVVTFRLYDKWTNEYIEIDTELAFADMAGTAKAPVLMGVLGGTTGIADVDAIDSNDIEAVYDATGRAVNEMTNGVYIIKVREGNRVVTKKVIK